MNKKENLLEERNHIPFGINIMNKKENLLEERNHIPFGINIMNKKENLLEERNHIPFGINIMNKKENLIEERNHIPFGINIMNKKENLLEERNHIPFGINIMNKKENLIEERNYIPLNLNFSQLQNYYHNLNQDFKFKNIINFKKLNNNIIKVKKSIVRLIEYLLLLYKEGNVQEFSESVALRIEARLHHIFVRINRLNLVAADNLLVSSKMKDLLGCVEEFEELFDDKRTVITKSRLQLGLETEQEDRTEIKRFNTHGNTPNSNDNVKGAPVHKWGFTFSGDSKGLSVTAFIERVEEYKLARNVSDSALKNSIIQLLQGCRSSRIYYVEELLKICKRLEKSRQLSSNFKSPSVNRVDVLEPDLACAPGLYGGSCNFKEDGLVVVNSVLRYWNCSREGHLYQKCGQARTRNILSVFEY
ncbi:hypothetical protein FQA39_LY15779 [Lamprigera yunnana]|nr:hypothetical protein FQA39_LY15779 [Lamprigera yunnana]